MATISLLFDQKMSDTHIQSLRDALSVQKWVVEEELVGNDYDISAVWKVARPDGKCRFSLEFDGMEEKGVLPISKSYGCHISESPNKSLYFSKISGSWSAELNEFVESIDG